MTMTLDLHRAPAIGPWEACFSFADAEQWAAFSGDYNPIHFEMARARSFGSDRLIVHGMVALMPVRFLISDHFGSAGGDDKWWRMKSVFRQPVPQDTQMAIVRREIGDGARYTLSPAGERADMIRVHYDMQPPPLVDADYALASVPQSRIHQFLDAYGDGLPAWMVADAAVFAGLVRSETDPIWDIVRREAERAWGPQEEPPMVVHAWHSVWHRATPMMSGSARALLDGTLTFSVGAISVDLLEDPKRLSMNCRIPLDVWFSGDRVMTVESSLIIIRTAGGLC
jgi:MaoC like domain